MPNSAFKSDNGIGLVIKSKKGSLVIEQEDQSSKEKHIAAKFSPESLHRFTELLQEQALLAWPELHPRNATSSGSDYWEYYDKELDNNGYLSIRSNNLIIEKPWPDSPVLYRFTKRKMESFIFDLKRNM